MLDKDTFDPDAVFLEDIVDDDVLPCLSLAVEGLTDTLSRSRAELLELGAGDPEPAVPAPAIPETEYDPEQLEVYGWETSLWRKIRGYLGF